MIPQNKDRLTAKKMFRPQRVRDFAEAEKLFYAGEIIGDKTILKGTFVPVSGVFEGWSSDNKLIKLRRQDGEILHFNEKDFARCKFWTSETF